MLSVLHNNVRSLKRNIEAFQNHLLCELDYPFSIIGVSETRIVGNQPLDFNPDLPGYIFEHVSTPLSAGGVGMYIADNINYHIVEKTSNIYFQALWIELVKEDKQSIICGVLYREHNDPTKFLDYLSETLYNFNKSSKTVCIMGDFNIDLLKYESSKYSKEFLNYLYSSAFFPTITKPTRIYGESATLIDNILLNKIEYKSVSGNIVSDISDHFSQFCILYNCKVRRSNGKRKIRDYTKFKKQNFLLELQANLDNGYDQATDVNTSFNTFYNKLNRLVNKHAPLKPLSKRKEKQLSKPWITKGIRTSIKMKNKHYHIGDGDRDKYRYYRNKISQLSRHSKSLYYHSFFESNYHNMKQTWKGINNLISSKKTTNKCINTILKPNSSVKTSNQFEISNILNKHFATVGNKLSSKFSLPQNSFSTYLGNSVKESFYFDAVSTSEILKEIGLIPKNKSYGLYSCPTFFLKLSKYILSPILANIINLTIECGTYPSKLKKAKIVPIFKSGDQSDPDNYRPISLLSVFNRIFEKIVYTRLISFIDKQNILFPAQYGFRKHHSTQLAIIDIVDKIHKNMDNKEYTCGVFIDLKKAFDTVDHSILLSKLYHYGMRGIIYEWFTSYLSDRSQTTAIGDYISKKENCSHGVPQGSVLGPLLFLLYINDISSSSNKLNFYLFADDTSMLYSHRNLRALEQNVNAELKNVGHWLEANKLTLNISKSNFVIFHPHQKNLDYVPQLKVFDHVSGGMLPLEMKSEAKYLGLLIDSNLTWKSHIDYVSLKLSRIVGIIARLRHFVPKHTLERIYYALVHPYLNYGISVWGQACKTHLNHLLVLQKRVLRLMNFANFRDHAIPFFINSGILPINFLYFYNIACNMHDVVNNRSPLTYPHYLLVLVIIIIIIPGVQRVVIFINLDQDYISKPSRFSQPV